VFRTGSRCRKFLTTFAAFLFLAYLNKVLASMKIHFALLDAPFVAKPIADEAHDYTANPHFCSAANSSNGVVPYWSNHQQGVERISKEKLTYPGN